MFQWTKVEDALPVSDELLLVVIADEDGDRRIRLAYYSPTRQRWFTMPALAAPCGEVTHWMPAPELPEEDEDETRD